MTDYRINLDIFSGPLDLLLYLVRKEEVDIYDIPIAKITEEYIRHIEMMQMFDIELAGEFLIMAAMLMEIKSAMLLPKDQVNALEEDASDPRHELIRQLLEYKKYKDAANMLNLSSQTQQQKFSRSDNIIQSLEPKTEPELDLESITVWDLLNAFDTMMKATGNLMDIRHITDDTPIDLYQIEVLHRLQNEGPMNFTRIFDGKKNKLVMIGLFLGVLELVREKLITAEQVKPGMPIYLRALTDEPAEKAVHEAMMSEEGDVLEQKQESPVDIQAIDQPEETQSEIEEETSLPIDIVEIDVPQQQKISETPVEEIQIDSQTESDLNNM
ncbi:MAG: segregation/condensation protein A [Planctomycetaceae bacterium]|nr:segregation/condensation protein A [Planctomycetaceae bacterium]